MRFRILLALCVFLCGPATAQALELRDGEKLMGTVTAFDFETKKVTVVDPLTKDGVQVPVSDLSLRSRQVLLFSPALHRSYPEGEHWPKEKVRLLIYGTLAPTLVLFAGFWISGWLIGGKLNPIRAFFGFLGGWIVGALFVAFYLFFALRFEKGTMLVGVGALLAMVFVPMFVSAIYQCSFLRGLGIFLFHLVAAACLLAIGLVALELLAPPDLLEYWWESRVFEPVGLSSLKLS